MRDDQMNISRFLEADTYQEFLQSQHFTFLEPFRNSLLESIQRNLNPRRNYQLSEWKKRINSLPIFSQFPLTPSVKDGLVCLDQPNETSEVESMHIEAVLRSFSPWRKGPFSIFGIYIDSEWQSNWKWDRIADCIQDLKGRKVLDIGSNNGYYLWRIFSQEAEVTVGLEPHLLYFAQSAIFQAYTEGLPVVNLPISLEDLTENCRVFDTVLSMGVLYHRKSPVEHLFRSKSCLREGGQFVLETLVIDGDENCLLTPISRYAKMPNVWCIPSVAYLLRLMKRCGFLEPQVIYSGQTGIEEQRSTEWMTFESLADFLDPIDPNKTIEGYPAPKRAIIIANSS